MSFDINQIIKEMLGAMKGSVADNWDDVKVPAQQFLERNKERLKMLAELRITGDLTQEKFESRLNDEKLIVEAQLNALAVVSKAIAQNAANAALEILNTAVKAAISAAL